MPVDGGEEKPIVEGLNNALNFLVADDGLYFVAFIPGPAPRKLAIEYFDVRTGRQTTLLTLTKPPSIGLTISPDHQYLLYSVVDNRSSNLMLVDNVR